MVLYKQLVICIAIVLTAQLVIAQSKDSIVDCNCTTDRFSMKKHRYFWIYFENKVIESVEQNGRKYTITGNGTWHYPSDEEYRHGGCGTVIKVIEFNLPGNENHAGKPANRWHDMFFIAKYHDRRINLEDCKRAFMNAHK